MKTAVHTIHSRSKNLMIKLFEGSHNLDMITYCMQKFDSNVWQSSIMKAYFDNSRCCLVLAMVVGPLKCHLMIKVCSHLK